MRKAFEVGLLITLTLLFGYDEIGQNINAINKDTLSIAKEKSYKMRLLVYMRVISDAQGSVRADENIVSNFKILNWLKAELGIRQGERPKNFDSYYHYKIELQTKWFWKTARIITRISDNVINFPAPSYRKTNELFILETKYRLSESFQGIAAGGYVFSSQQYNELNASPIFQGNQVNYPTFKLAIRYLLKNKGFVEAVYGSYDVFNPYELNRPFIQIAGEYELSHACTLYSYLRYQYNYDVSRPYNYFLGAGLMFHFLPN
jgi:hypothetical protein